MYGPEAHESFLFFFLRSSILLVTPADTTGLLRRLGTANVVDTEKQTCGLKSLSGLL